VQIAEAAAPGDAFAASSVAAWYFFLFPNLMLNFYPWGLSLNVVVPAAVDRTRIVYRSWVVDPSRRGSAGARSTGSSWRTRRWWSRCTRRALALYERGRYSPSREAGVHHFHRLLTRLVG